MVVRPADPRLGWWLAAALLLPAVALTQPTPAALEQAQRAARAQREAAEAAAEASRAAAAAERRLAERRVEAARQLQAAERHLADIEQRSRTAAEAATAARGAARAQAEALAPMLPTMLRLALWPAESLLAVPAPAEDALRGLLVLQGLSRSMTEEAATLRAAEAEAGRRAAAAAAQAAALREAETAARLATLVLEADLKEARERRAQAEDAEEAAARRAATAAARATSLEGALARLRREEARVRAAAAARARTEAARRQDASAPSREPAQPAPRGGRAMPVAGQVVRDFGSAGEGGPARGITLAAPAGARVVSPCAGRTAFAAAFRSYGLLLIVDCGDGYHFVLAGLDRLDTAPGQRLLAGEPVGQLGAAAPDGRGRASLYLELRRGGRPVDPRSWLAARG
ncbi:hypothetical protein GCM10011504_14400 [Siccirubricoccus deserti]|uniref:Peptidoglycan DD-metalloendopeptidase family protein n=1 Tax=Siccirubricoccus deserti TaxID=2013562 RepID=A0A9X0QVW5_9PROT|nr:peptidoglycan DD-metalloendopeptidase family protein [Siccirubricoccus deserti]MBC4014909.1 peptidoglycan DD-metalloendopeptidase family protein [Siccirubricoccus deserti]GGC37166.1 hypothetical protein GCM10011504_14400 [Siccirubricoccus deserti]